MSGEEIKGPWQALAERWPGIVREWLDSLDWTMGPLSASEVGRQAWIMTRTEILAAEAEARKAYRGRK